mgnify:CR=1 FL=1
MSDYRGIDLSIEFQSMFNAIVKVKDRKVRMELLENLGNIQQVISTKSKVIREVITSLGEL